MARPKKILKEELESAQEEAEVVDVASANASHKDALEARLIYLQDLRSKFEAEGVNSIGSLDVVIGRVIQELGTL